MTALPGGPRTPRGKPWALIHHDSLSAPKIMVGQGPKEAAVHKRKGPTSWCWELGLMPVPKAGTTHSDDSGPSSLGDSPKAIKAL